MNAKSPTGDGPILAPTFLFRYSVPCRHFDGQWSARGIELDEAFVVPSFGQLEDRPIFADVRLGWNDSGLALTARVEGKRQTPWCRATRADDSDGVQLWIDTRDTHNIHRAGRFCHRAVFLPAGGGRKLDRPVAEWLPIPRARENPKPAAAGALKIRAEKRVDGYRLSAWVPAAALTGFDPAEHPRLGFCYAVIDRELGRQTFTVGTEFPIESDPSLWGTLELVKD